MGTINPTIPTIGDPNATEDADVRSALITIRDEINGLLDSNNLANNAVASAKIADLAVTSGKLADAAVATAKVADSAITSGKLATDSKNLFLQLITNVETKVNFGAHTFSPTTAGPVASSTVTHGLGATPDIVLATAVSQFFNATATNLTATTFSVTLRHIDATDWISSQTVYWLAIATPP